MAPLRLVSPRRASILDGSPQKQVKGAWQLLSLPPPPRVTCVILSSTPLLPRNPGRQMAQAGCVYLGPWKPAASFSYHSESGTGLQPSSKQRLKGGDCVIHNPRVWAWSRPGFAPLRNYSSHHADASVPSEVLGLSQTGRDPGDSPSNPEPTSASFGFTKPGPWGQFISS